MIAEFSEVLLSVVFSCVNMVGDVSPSVFFSKCRCEQVHSYAPRTFFLPGAHGGGASRNYCRPSSQDSIMILCCAGPITRRGGSGNPCSVDCIDIVLVVGSALASIGIK